MNNKSILYIFLIFFIFLGWTNELYGQSTYHFWRALIEATDATSVTDGLKYDLVYEEDSHHLYKCNNEGGGSVPGDFEIIGTKGVAVSITDVGGYFVGIELETILQEIGTVYSEVKPWTDYVTLGSLGSLTLPTGQNFTIGSTQWNSADNIDGDKIAFLLPFAGG